jgi:hypothetical protein
MSKETFDQMIARVTAKKGSAANGGPPPPPKLSPAPVTIPAPSASTRPTRK